MLRFLDQFLLPFEDWKRKGNPIDEVVQVGDGDIFDGFDIWGTNFICEHHGFAGFYFLFGRVDVIARDPEKKIQEEEASSKHSKQPVELLVCAETDIISVRCAKDTHCARVLCLIFIHM